MCSLRHGDGTLPNCSSRGLQRGERVGRDEGAVDAARVQRVRDRAAVEHAFGGVEQRVRGEDLLEGRGHLEVRSDDRGAEDRRVEPGELLEHAGDRPLRLLADGARRVAHEARRAGAEELRGVVDESLLSVGHEGDVPFADELGTLRDRDHHGPAGLGEASQRAPRPAIGSGCHATLTARVRYRETDVMAEADEEATWRGEVVAFLAAHARLRTGIDDWSTSPIHETPDAEAAYFARCRAWQQTVFDGGFAGITWPVEYGGRGGRPWQQAVYREEEARYDVSSGFIASTIALVGRGVDDARTRRTNRRGTSVRCCAPTRCGASCSASPTRAPTSRTSARAP